MSDIAVVGLSCKLPGVSSVEDFHRLLFDPRSRALNSCSDQDWYKGFDNKFFFITDEESAAMDPQQKLFLAMAYWALEDSLICSSEFPEKTGVYVGSSSFEFAMNKRKSDSCKFRLPGLGNNFIANRVSNFFNFTGPSMVVDASCASSMLAVKHACSALIAKEISLAITGGVHIHASDYVDGLYQNSGLISKKGQCRPLSNSADGFVRGEGGGSLVLKRLDEALESGNKIYAVIKGCYTNHNGTSLNITSPNLKAQLSLYEDAYGKSGVSPSDIDFVETSASGNSLGDKIEYSGLKQYFCENRNTHLYLGVLKNLIGNLESASGTIALIKAVLLLHDKKIPSQKIDDPLDPVFPLIEKSYSTLQLACEKGQCFGAVNNFGLGGSNVHTILSSHTTKHSDPNAVESDEQVFLLSAHTKDALKSRVIDYVRALEVGESNAIPLVQLASKAQRYLAVRISVVYSDRVSLIDQLKKYIDGSSSNEIYSGCSQHEPELFVNVRNVLSFVKGNELELRRFVSRSMNGFAEKRADLQDDMNAQYKKNMFLSFVKSLMSNRHFNRQFPDFDEAIRNSSMSPDVNDETYSFQRADSIFEVESAEGQREIIGAFQCQSIHHVRAKMFALGFNVCTSTPYCAKDIRVWPPLYPLFNKPS
ncbi:polyketide synthase [Teredinibacter turnerae]|uniref:polyketide synthase n=1 Tax=Teredinibacter turnerae TaxID=2426 RepID=UPI00040A6D74|nr:polyketide synthase [Teredinibacter turnerae]